MAQIRVNDIFDKLIEENIEINECLNILIKFKTFVDLIFIKLKNNLESNDLQKFYDLDKEVKNVFKSQKRQLSSGDKNQKQRKSQLFEVLSLKPQNCQKSTRLQINSITNNHSIDSINDKNRRKRNSIPAKNKSKVLLQNHKQNSIKRKNITIVKNNSFGERIKSKKSSKSSKRHRNHELFICDVEGCQFTTYCKESVESHTNRHKGLKPYVCDVCDHKFGSAFNLNKHNLRAHKRPISERKFKCLSEGCLKAFRSQHELKVHSIIHSDFAIPCDWPGCEYTSKWKGQLLSHRKIHTSERPFLCDWPECGKRYKDKYSLKFHQRVHLNDKCYACSWPGCEYTSKWKNQLLAHNLIHSSERPFLCDWPECGKRFKNKIYLKTHQRIHSSDKRYACSWPGCQYRCTDSGNLYKHRRVHIKN